MAERLWQDYQRGGRSDRPRLFADYELSPPVHNRTSARLPRRQARHMVEFVALLWLRLRLVDEIQCFRNRPAAGADIRRPLRNT